MGLNGVGLIGVERSRQMDVENWTQEHDDMHRCAELSAAACTYGLHAMRQIAAGDKVLSITNGLWPWSLSWWKPSDDPIRNLVKAGALIAAEIDRLQRAKEK